MAASGDTDSCETGSGCRSAMAGSRWPGWPGCSVFRLVVRADKVSAFIGKKGENIKKMEEDTKARIRVLRLVPGAADQIVLVSAKEELEAEVSPAMEGALRVFQFVNEITKMDGSATSAAEGCSIRLLVPSLQAIHVIGKQGSTVKMIKESSGASIWVHERDALPSYAIEDERVVQIQGESMEVYSALGLIVGLLRKFLVDQGVLPLFEKRLLASTQDPVQMSGLEDTSSPHMPCPPFYALEDPLDYSVAGSSISTFERDVAISSLHQSRETSHQRRSNLFVSQITQTMEVPLYLAEEIIGAEGVNISYIRRASQAIITLQESKVHPDEITIEIKGNAAEVQSAQELIQDVLNMRETTRPSYGDPDTTLWSSHNYSVPSPSLRWPSHHYSEHASSVHKSYHHKLPSHGEEDSMYQPSFANESSYSRYRG